MIPEVEPRHTGESRHPASQHSVIDTAKKLVPTIDLADRLIGPGQLRKIGKEWVGRCPLPGHDEKTPSFTVNPEKNLFYCHGCTRGGDVVRLALYAWGYLRGEDAMVAAELLHEFGHDVPSRPPAWFARQERQKPIRDAVEETIKGDFRRRAFKYIVLPCLQRSDAPAERKAEIAAAWQDFEATMRAVGR